MRVKRQSTHSLNSEGLLDTQGHGNDEMEFKGKIFRKNTHVTAKPLKVKYEWQIFHTAM